MPKVTLKMDDFKTLASDTRLNILKALDGKKLGLKELSSITNLHKMTLHEHLTKLVETGFVKRIERKGHKWVYYTLTWKGKSLFHPDNTKVVVLFSTTIFTFIAGIIGFITAIKNYMNYKVETEIKVTPLNRNHDWIPQPNKEELLFNQDPVFIYLLITCFIIFVILLIFSIKLYKKNKKISDLTIETIKEN